MTKHSTESAFSQARRGLKSSRPLSPFEQYRLKPTQQLRDRLVQANWGLVQKEARRWAHQCSEPFDDLTQEGSFGLLSAIEKFDPSSGNAFSSFAIPWIRGAIQHYLRDKGWGTVRPPRRAVETYARVKGAQRRLTALGRELSEEDVALGFGLTADGWRYVKEAREQPSPVSLDESPLEVEDEASEQDFEWVIEHLEALPEVTRRCVIERVFGQLSVEVIAQRRGIPPVVVTGLISSGLAAMKMGIQEDQRYADH